MRSSVRSLFTLVGLVGLALGAVAAAAPAPGTPGDQLFEAPTYQFQVGAKSNAGAKLGGDIQSIGGYVENAVCVCAAGGIGICAYDPGNLCALRLCIVTPCPI